MTDIEGNLLKVRVHAANISDTVAGCEVFFEAMWKYPSIEAAPLTVGQYADEGYRGTFVDYLAGKGVRVDISERIKPVFEILPKRWRVERTFAWLNSYRGLSKDYEITASSEEANVMIAHTHTLLRRCFPSIL